VMETPICQVAFSVGDLVRSHAWYEQLGLESTGGMGPLSGEHPAKMLDLPELEVKIDWLRGQDSMSQIELIHFIRPTPLPLPPDWTLAYAGYGMVSFLVADFEATWSRLRANHQPLAVTGANGTRSMWIKDPDGVTIEILEKDPLGLRDTTREDRNLASIRAITITVADLDKAKRFWTQAVGLSECPRAYPFNVFPRDVDGGVRDWEQVHLKGDSLIVRLLKPHSASVIPRASGRRLSDAGVLNIAVIVDTKQGFESICGRCTRMGYRFSTEEPMLMGDEAGTRYGHDDQGTSIEIGFVRPGHEVKYGWKR
jgi:catechol 2,3-dioxygenase-like lactoylglutathione lyase family enzyme